MLWRECFYPNTLRPHLDPKIIQCFGPPTWENEYNFGVIFRTLSSQKYKRSIERTEISTKTHSFVRRPRKIATINFSPRPENSNFLRSSPKLRSHHFTDSLRFCSSNKFEKVAGWGQRFALSAECKIEKSTNFRGGRGVKKNITFGWSILLFTMTVRRRKISFM